MARKQDLGTARAPVELGFFDGHEADWLMQRSLSYTSEKAAEIGECLSVARRIDEKDADSWIEEWSAMGQRLADAGEDALGQGERISARETLLRACNYFRIAEYGCLPSDPRFHELWKKSVTAFRTACPLYDPPVQFEPVPFEGARLPAYFWRPDDSSTTRPTLIIAGGNDDTGEEDFFIIGPAAVRRGYNIFIFEYPGHRGAVHTDPDQIKRPDYEVPFAAALDHLERLPGVDDRLALMGFSGGGYVAPRVAIHDDRIKAVIPNSPMIDYARVADALLGPMIRRIPGPILKWGINRKLARNPLIHAYMEYGLWTTGREDMSLYEWMNSEEAQREWAKFNIVDDLHHITCPSLALVGAAEGEEMLRQTEEYHRGISSQNNAMYTFTIDRDGSHDHCMLDNISRMHQIVFQWLNDVFDYRKI